MSEYEDDTGNDLHRSLVELRDPCSGEREANDDALPAPDVPKIMIEERFVGEPAPVHRFDSTARRIAKNIALIMGGLALVLAGILVSVLHDGDPWDTVGLVIGAMGIALTSVAWAVALAENTDAWRE